MAGEPGRRGDRFAWLGDWVHGDIPLGWDYLSRFEPALEAPRFGRALLVAAAVATAFIGWSFYRRPETTPDSPDAQALAEAEAVLNRYGGSEFAHLLFLGDKFLLWSPDRTAFIQYGQIRDRLVALGDPCGNPAAFDAAIIAFREHADNHDLTPCFYEISAAHMHRYHDTGFALFKLGEMAIVDLASFTTAGKRGESLRHSVNRARRGGVSFELLEQPLSAGTVAGAAGCFRRLAGRAPYGRERVLARQLQRSLPAPQPDRRGAGRRAGRRLQPI